MYTLIILAKCVQNIFGGVCCLTQYFRSFVVELYITRINTRHGILRLLEPVQHKRSLINSHQIISASQRAATNARALWV